MKMKHMKKLTGVLLALVMAWLSDCRRLCCKRYRAVNR